MTADIALPKDWDRSGLPGWAYFSQELFELECETLFKTHWQFVCHVNEAAEIGAYVTFDVAGERALVIRGHDGILRGFHNLCRHRGSRIVPDARGVCNKAMVCPYHGWAYNLDGGLRGIANRDTFPPMQAEKWGLKPLEMEIWNGLVFIRFQAGPQPAVAEILARFDDEIAPYDLANMVPTDSNSMDDLLAVNWKSVRDVDNEGYHVRQAHPGLHQLYGDGYFDEPYANGTSRSVGTFNEAYGHRWSVRKYREILPEAENLPLHQRRQWIYFGMFPNFVLGLYPDSVIYYQEVPQSATQTVQRGMCYRRREESREMKAARYLSGRIDRDTAEEDQMLMVWSCEATKSSAYDGVIFSDLEYGVKTYHDHLRRLLPVMGQPAPPEPGQMAQVNDALLGKGTA
ncbi:aromatic ring-hydroxylating dioxygenase subunit alpha [Planktomarina temperata]|jgi:phenylpropionate dioxygenase-like ring-hydroxylating dioxygenase large terminal subunit|uniref:SRPBCC family protein n=3 Tax=Paracoccaceae TaxID=31989 RepID=UPI000E7F0649|nr:aromatic ring-hydroxylating dioxygenase subunit alpha [Planktomarina temperata]MDA9317677.1 aromatic ring-hydroxylating dioxygenase subunit alpha [bacterium]MCO4808511.1 aromatic ring-hydroxylating dioxygenase subunit alpha [Planktomarina temperata]MDA7454647.1 aromatic ring-hydroxylating dioxygenase subunit alpha [Planktomarina temperata]MDA7458949.1 aromatic ring-hydroxylating dioxygenase subunit alpha [Planktomarina temperata]